MKESIMEIPRENEAVIRLGTQGGEELELRQSKTRIYTFLGAYAMSHLFIEADDQEQQEEGRVLGNYLFLDQLGTTEEIQIETMQKILSIAMQGGFELHLNIQDPAECDIEAYTEHVLKGIDDGNFSPEK